jgi:hypothetical protein
MRDEERLFKVGRTWHTWFYLGGRRIKRSTHRRSKSAARAEARKWEEAASDPARAAAEAVTVEDALHEVLQDRREQAKAGERSPETVQFFEKKSGVLVRARRRDAVRAPSAAVLDEYVSTRRRDPGSDHSIYKELVRPAVGAEAGEAARDRWFGDSTRRCPALAEYEPARDASSASPSSTSCSPSWNRTTRRARRSVSRRGAELRATTRALREDLNGGGAAARVEEPERRWRRCRS